jgi:hypothetical protein
VDFVPEPEGLACKSVWSDEVALFNFARENPNAELDLVFVKPLGVDGGGGIMLLARGVADETD